jgi:hypothetical protein
MNDVDQATRAPQRRLAAPTVANESVRDRAEPHAAAPGAPTPAGSANRRQLLTRGAGVLGVLAGGALLSRAEPATAATAATTAASETTLASAREKHLALQVTLAPLQTRQAVWADHEWDFGAHFTGARPPVVVATALDDYMQHDPSTFCVCAVAVHGTPGAYRATIMVRNISKRATTVVINAVAVGE